MLNDPSMLIRPALPADTDNIWQVLEPTIRAGETQALPQDMSREDALGYWLSANNQVFVAEQEGTVVGSYFLRANQAGGGNHVANCAYMVSPPATGRGIAQAMCEHSLEQARAQGFLAMQFNFVVSSNAPAVHLWQAMGFRIAGVMTGGFRHPRLGYVDAYMMYQEL